MEILITREELEKIPYGTKLKKKLEELNLAYIWAPGKKKALMLDEAMEALEDLRQKLIKEDLEKFGMNENQIEDKTKEQKTKIEFPKFKNENPESEKPKIEEKVVGKEDKIQARKMKAKLNLTKEEIEEQLRVIELNLINTPCDHIGRILRDKRAILEAELEKLK